MPESYTPKHLAEKILTSKGGLEGERKQVTVLFADLKGSMELLADRDPEDARALLDPLLEHMMDAVHRFEGTVNQVMGDGIMALFGAPLAHEDHAVRACYAALRMQDTVRRYAEQVQRSHGITARIRVGLNSGEVVVRAIGSDLRMDYTAVGHTTHLAARMEQLAEPGTTLLTPAALRLTEGYVDVRSRGPVSVKGLPEPLEVYELIGAAPVRSRFQVVAARGLTRFVGRARELDRLGGALERAGAGHGQVIAVVGEAGVGKSRLCWEFTHSPRTRGWLVAETAATPYGKAVAYAPLVDLLRAYRLTLPIRANLRAWQAEAYATLGEFEAALASAAEARQIATEIDHPQTGWLATAYTAHVLLTKGAIDAAAAMYRLGLAVAEDNELLHGVLATSLGLAQCQCLLGEPPVALERLPHDPTPWEPLKSFSRTVGRYGALKASAYLAAGRLEVAEAEIAHGLAQARLEHARGYEVALCRLRAQALGMRGGDHRDAADACWRRSIELAAQLGARPELAHAHLGLGRLLRDTGARDRAGEHLRTALTLYRQMDMGMWLRQAELDVNPLG